MFSFLQAFLLFHLFSSVASISLQCPNVNVKPRREGFIRHSCIPGHHTGTCLVFLKKMRYQEAIHRCFLYYGGRLATVGSGNDAVYVYQKWRSAMHWHPTLDVKEDNKKFWVALGQKGFEETVIPYAKNLIFLYDEKIWQHLFPATKTQDNPLSEKQANQLNIGEFCPAKRVVFDPSAAPEGYNRTIDSKAFTVVPTSEKHYGLCEVPRWALLQCPEKWFLLGSSRICVKIFDERVTYKEAQSRCKSKDAALGVPSERLEQVRYGELMTQVLGINKKMWIGLKAGEMNYSPVLSSLDGSELWRLRLANPVKNSCAVLIHDSGNSEDPITSMENCNSAYPYVCYKFADQSLAKDPSMAENDGEIWHI